MTSHVPRNTCNCSHPPPPPLLPPLSFPSSLSPFYIRRDACSNTGATCRGFAPLSTTCWSPLRCWRRENTCSGPAVLAIGGEIKQGVAVIPNTNKRVAGENKQENGTAYKMILGLCVRGRGWNFVHNFRWKKNIKSSSSQFDVLFWLLRRWDLRYDCPFNSYSRETLSSNE